MKELINKIDPEMTLVILFLGIGLLLSLFLAMENLASAIVGAFAGYLARTIKQELINKGGNVKWAMC